MKIKPSSAVGTAIGNLANLFRSMEVGEVVTYSTMNAAAEIDVRETNVHRRAKLIVLREDAIHLGCVHGVGYKRLNPKEASEEVGSQLNRVRNAARRGVLKASKVDILALPVEERAKFVMRASLCSMISESTSSKSKEKVLELAQKEDTAVIANRLMLQSLL